MGPLTPELSSDPFRFDDFYGEPSPTQAARVRVERLLSHFRRFLSPEDDTIRQLEHRLATLLPPQPTAHVPHRL